MKEKKADLLHATSRATHEHKQLCQCNQEPSLPTNTMTGDLMPSNKSQILAEARYQKIS